MVQLETGLDILTLLRTALFFPLLLLVCSAKAQQPVLHIYQDADLFHHAESSLAIQKGIEVAFSEINYDLEGYRIEFKYLDHRGNVVRSKQNFQEYLDDPQALAIFSGIHSPPLIRNRSFINDNKALTLVPWAAGASITRYPSTENWVFRLSVDDSRAGKVIVDYALDTQFCQSPHLLLEDTPWGDSNLLNMSVALDQWGVQNPGVSRFGWGIKERAAKIIVRDILDKQADCIILVANPGEGTTFVNALIDEKNDTELNLVSHWGITGGDFHELVPSEHRNDLDLAFIQTCFAFTNAVQNDFSIGVFDSLKAHSNGEIESPEDLHSAVGFIHAYDLSRLLIAAVKQSGLTGDMESDRNAVRLALENLTEPVQGLVKTYQSPFAMFDSELRPNAHEALHEENYCMAQYGEHNEIQLIDVD